MDLEILLFFIGGLSFFSIGLFFSIKNHSYKKGIKYVGTVVGFTESYGFKMQRIHVPLVEISTSKGNMHFPSISSFKHYSIGDEVVVFYNNDTDPYRVFISEGIKDYLVLLFFWMFGMPLLISSIYMFMVYINN